MNQGVLFNTDRLSREQLLAYARRLDELGYESLWLPELFTRDPFTASAFLLANTRRIKLATGIANVYGRDATATVSASSTLAEMSDGRFILGLGVSNAGLAKARGHEWQNPVDLLESYLADMAKVKLTSHQAPFQTHVAAHGPKMLALAAAHADGVNTYLMPRDHAVRAREAIGNKDLNTMLFCLADENPETARNTARRAIAYYMGLDYYHRAWRSLGFDAQDYANGGSDRLIDSLVAWGSMAVIKERIMAQQQAGATRVVVIPIGAGLGGQPDWQLLQGLAE